MWGTGIRQGGLSHGQAMDGNRSTHEWLRKLHMMLLKQAKGQGPWKGMHEFGFTQDHVFEPTNDAGGDWLWACLGWVLTRTLNGFRSTHGWVDENTGNLNGSAREGTHAAMGLACTSCMHMGAMETEIFLYPQGKGAGDWKISKPRACDVPAAWCGAAGDDKPSIQKLKAHGAHLAFCGTACIHRLTLLFSHTAGVAPDEDSDLEIIEDDPVSAGCMIHQFTVKTCLSATG